MHHKIFTLNYFLGQNSFNKITVLHSGAWRTGADMVSEEETGNSLFLLCVPGIRIPSKFRHFAA